MVDSDSQRRRTSIRQVTPLVIDGVMYYNAGSKLFAVDAATGASLWTYQVDPAFPGSGRGPTYADGHIYAYGGPYGGNVLYAVDAKTGQPLQSFGSKGRLLVADEVVKAKYPNKDAAGYRLVGPPTYLNGMLYVGLSQSERHIPGGLVAAMDAQDGSRQVGVQHDSAVAGRRRVGDCERHLDRRPAGRRRDLDAAGRSIPSWA